MAEGARILVVEDNDKLLSLLRRALEREGYEVIAARNGVETMKELYVEKGAPSTLVPKIERVLLRLSERELAKARSTIPIDK